MAKAIVYVTYKKSVLDPQGEAVRGSLVSLGFGGVRDVRVGKYIEIDIEDGDRESLRAKVDEMCRQLLANPVIEDYRVELSEESEMPSAPAPGT